MKFQAAEDREKHKLKTTEFKFIDPSWNLPTHGAMSKMRDRPGFIPQMNSQHDVLLFRLPDQVKLQIIEGQWINPTEVQPRCQEILIHG